MTTIPAPSADASMSLIRRIRKIPEKLDIILMSVIQEMAFEEKASRGRGVYVFTD